MLYIERRFQLKNAGGRMRKALVLFATSFILASSLLLVGSAQASDPSISITPDTSVFIYGGDSVRIWIYASDADMADTITVEKTDGIGTYVPNTDLAPISDEFYFHPDTSGVYTFIFPVTDGQGATDADTTKVAVATKKVDFSQSANDDSPYPPGDVHWISSILQEGNSEYYEGMSALQRLVFVGIPKTPGHVHTLSFSHQAHKSTSHAYDFLTSWAQAVQAGSEIGGPTMFVNVNECGPDIGPPAYLGSVCVALHTSGFTATPDAPDTMGNLLGDDVASKVAAYEAQLGNRTVKMYGNTPISAASIAFLGYNGSTDKEAHYMLTWTSSSDSIVIEMAGHLAAGTDPIGQAAVGYGEGKGSSNISGGSYHFKLAKLDGATLGSQDNQIKGADIRPRPPACDVTPPSQEVCVGFDATFTDNSTGGAPPYTFCWQKSPYTDPCISTTNQLSITGATLTDAGTYRVIVTDDKGGADTCYATLIVHEPPTCSVDPPADTIWEGDLATFCVVPSGGTAPYTYLWSTGETSDCITVSPPAGVYTYSVIVTDDKGCAGTCECTLTVLSVPPGVLTCPEDDSVHATVPAVTFVSTDFSVTGPGADPANVRVISIDPPPAAGMPSTVESHVEWLTDCDDAGKVFTICLEATFDVGPKDTCCFEVTVYNRPPQLSCPDNDSVHAGYMFLSTNFSVTDPDGDPAPVTFLDVTPPAGVAIVETHLEWVTTCDDVGEYAIQLVATDPCGASDTCEFTLIVYDLPPQIVCPDDDSVHAGDFFISTDFSAWDPAGGPVTVALCGITPAPIHTPTIVGRHVEWKTDCHEAGKVFAICLEATDTCGAKDTCYFDVTVQNRPPELTCPDDGSVHAGELFVSTDFSVYDPEGDTVSVHILGVSRPVTNYPTIVDQHIEWQTTCQEDGDYVIRLVASECCQPKDTCEFTVTVYNRPSELLCPENAMVYAGDTLVSTDFSVTDPDGDSAPVTFLDIDPSATNQPTIVGSHVEWITTSNEADRDFRIRLVATDPCGLADTCEFTVAVVSTPTGDLTCPEDDSVHATVPAVTFVSTNFSVTGPGADPANVRVISIDPSPAAGMPARVESHIEWLTDCDDAGKVFTICLEATFDVGPKDTCCFEVTVYNRAPELTCPDDDSVFVGEAFVSTDFSVADPDGDSAPVTFLDIAPPATNQPTIVASHVEWVTTFSEQGDYTIRLVTTDPCGLADTCEFTVAVVGEITGDLICPEDDSIHATEPPLTFVSTDFTITGPGTDPSDVTVFKVEPPPVNWPFIVESHVEWLTDCDDAGKTFTIWLEAPVGGEEHDSCYFQVVVYNRPPVLTCPDYGQVAPNETFVSTDISVYDPDEDPVTVTILSIEPTATYDPTMVDDHVEWLATCEEAGKDFVIRLVATDPCGLADTCEFTVTVSYHPEPDFHIWVYPVTQYVQNGGATQYLVELYSLYGFANPCSLFVSGLPHPPITISLDHTVLVPTSHTTLHVQTAVETDSGVYPFTIRAKEISGPIEHTVQVYLMVEDPADAGDWADNVNAPKTFALFQNQPNPFNPETEISYYLPEDCQVRLSIYNVLGRRVRTLFDGYQNAGTKTLIWDGKNDNAVELSSGIYFYLLEVDDFRESKKMTLTK
jgi:hypothetical protein